MKQSDGKSEKLENPILFCSSIGVAISASTATTMKFDTLGLILSVAAGVTIGAIIGYFTQKEQKKDQANIKKAL